MAESYIGKLLQGKAIKKCALWFNLVVDFGEGCVLSCDEASIFIKSQEVIPYKDVIGLRFVDFKDDDEFEIFVFENEIMLKVPRIDVEHWVYEDNAGVIVVSN